MFASDNEGWSQHVQQYSLAIPTVKSSHNTTATITGIKNCEVRVTLLNRLYTMIIAVKI
jgi:hypothetical protein